MNIMIVNNIQITFTSSQESQAKIVTKSLQSLLSARAMYFPPLLKSIAKELR